MILKVINDVAIASSPAQKKRKIKKEKKNITKQKLQIVKF